MLELQSEELVGRIGTLNLVPIRKERKTLEEKSKPKKKKPDWSKQRERKRSYE